MRTETCVTWVVCSLCLITLSVCRPIKDDEREAFASENEERLLLAAKLLQQMQQRHAQYGIRYYPIIPTHKRNLGTVDSLYNLPDLLYRGKR